MLCSAVVRVLAAVGCLIAAAASVKWSLEWASVGLSVWDHKTVEFVCGRLAKSEKGRFFCHRVSGGVGMNTHYTKWANLGSSNRMGVWWVVGGGGCQRGERGGGGNLVAASSSHS